jgi:hypothetical protein
MPRPPRSWTQAREKFYLRGGRCQVCPNLRGRRVELAHVVGREHDYTAPVRMDGEWWPGVVAPDRVVLLCGPATDTTTCHGQQHGRVLDLLPYLTLEEQVQAVADAGGISQAYDRLVPSEGPRGVRGLVRQPLPGGGRA